MTQLLYARLQVGTDAPTLPVMLEARGAGLHENFTRTQQHQWQSVSYGNASTAAFANSSDI